MPFYSAQELLEVFHRKYGPAGKLGWGPRMRLWFGQFSPDDIYEATVASLVTPDTAWLDAGCGRDIFSFNIPTAKILAERCRLLVGVDPSENIHRNELVHERYQCQLSEFPRDRQFDLITLRMVVEHITDPGQTAAILSSLCAPGGRVVVFTVFKWSPGTVLSAVLPFWLHHPIKRFLWSTPEEDTFPAVYRMNTRASLRSVFGGAGFEEEGFSYLDDCRTLARWRVTQALELLLWKALRTFHLHYPEVCLLGVYRKRA